MKKLSTILLVLATIAVPALGKPRRFHRQPPIEIVVLTRTGYRWVSLDRLRGLDRKPIVRGPIVHQSLHNNERFCDSLEEERRLAGKPREPR